MMTQRRYEAESEEDRKEKVPAKLRLEVDPQTSIRYVNSKAFEKGYMNKPVWFYYRRNHKGQFPPKTRKNCLDSKEVIPSIVVFYLCLWDSRADS